MLTLPDYPGVFRIWHRSPALPYGSPYLPDKIIFWAFLCLYICSVRFSPFLAQHLNFSYSQLMASGVFLHIFIHWQRLYLASKRWLQILIVCTVIHVRLNLRSGVIFLLLLFASLAREGKNTAWYIHLTSRQPPRNLHNRELKQQRRWRLQKRHLKSEFAPLQTLSRLFHLLYFVKCWQMFLELNSKGLYQSSGKEKKVVVLCSRPRQNVNSGTFTL